MTHSDKIRDATATELIAEIQALTSQEGPNETPWPGLTAYRFSRPVPLRTDDAASLALCYVAQGSMRFVVGSADNRCGPSHYLLLSRGLRFQTEIVDAGDPMPHLSLVLQLDPAVVRTVAAQLAHLVDPGHLPEHAQPPGPIPATPISLSQAPLRAAMVRLLRSLADPADRKVVAPLALQEITYRLLLTEHVVDLLAAAAVERHGDPLAEAIAFAREHMGRPLTVADIAEHVNLSATALTGLFVEATGLGPYQFLKRLRLDHAATLLMQRELTVSAIAERVGYATASHFASAFKESYGLTPRRYADAQSTAVAMRIGEATSPRCGRAPARAQ